jgi:hypothetical protein
VKTNAGRGAKLEFYAHIYFLVYAMKNTTGEEAEKSKLEEAKLNFRQFIESADKLSQTTEFLHFYALPYVPNPQVHPQLKECFTDEWAISKQEEFESYLTEKINPNKTASKPELEKLLNQTTSMSNLEAENVEELTRRLKHAQKSVTSAEKKANQYARKFSQLQKDYHNLINIAAELVDTLEKSVYGETVDVEYLADICRRLFQNDNSKLNQTSSSVNVSTIVSRPGTASSLLRQSLNQNVTQSINRNFKNSLAAVNQSLKETPETSKSTQNSQNSSKTNGTSTFEHPSVNSRPNSSRQIRTPDNHNSQKLTIPGTVPSLNYQLIIQILQDCEGKQDANRIGSVLKTLQALRWRITKANTGAERIEVVRQYIDAGVLDVFHRFEHKILSESTHFKIVEYHARLYNTVASVALGRSFLTQNNKISQFLANILKNYVGVVLKDSQLDILRDNLLGTLQKLSLKRRIQSSLISGGVVEYLLDTLGADVIDEKLGGTKKQLFVLTDYALEYCTALLMNLCLRSLGRVKAADHGAPKLLSVMTELLRHDDIEVRPYTNGILYTMLQDKRVWDEAQKINLKEMINDFSDNIPLAPTAESSDPNDIKRQFEYLQKQLERTEPPKSGKTRTPSGDHSDDEADGEDDEETEEDIIEPDLDANDLTMNGLVGEEFLRSLSHDANFIPTKPISVSRSGSRQSLRRSNGVSFNGSINGTVKPSQALSSHSLATTIKPDHQTETSINLDDFTLDGQNLSQINQQIQNSQTTQSLATTQNNKSVEQQFRSMQVDNSASDKLNSLGIDRKVVRVNPEQSLPSPRNVSSEDSAQLNAYTAAFGSRPKVPRTPDPRSRSRTSNVMT